MKFSIKDFFSKCDQIRRIWSHLPNNSLMENFFVQLTYSSVINFRKILIKWGANKLLQFYKRGLVLLGYSLMIIKCSRGSVFEQCKTISSHKL